MDQPADRPPVIVVRIPAIVVRLSVIVAAPVTAVLRRLPAEVPATAPTLPPPRSGTLRRLAVPAARLLGLAVLVAAIVLVSATPAWAAQVVQEHDLWNLTGLLPSPRLPDSSHLLPLLLSSVVVLAVVSSHTGHHHDHW